MTGVKAYGLWYVVELVFIGFQTEGRDVFSLGATEFCCSAIGSTISFVGIGTFVPPLGVISKSLGGLKAGPEDGEANTLIFRPVRPFRESILCSVER